MVNRNPFYKVYVGDEHRLRDGLSTDAYGLYAIIRNKVHDANPYAHLVDAHSVPMTDEDLSELSGLRASAFRAAFNDLLARRAVWSSAEWFAQVRSQEHSDYVEIARELVAGVRRFAVLNGTSSMPDDRVPHREPLIVPALADQYVRSTFGKRTGRKRGQDGDVRGDLTSPLTSPLTGDVPGYPNAHIHDNEHDHERLGSVSVLIPGRKKKKPSTTRGGGKLELRELPVKPPWSWEKHLFLCDQVRKLDADLKRDRADVLEDPDAYAAHFLGRLQVEFRVYQEAQDYWQHGPNSTRPVPQPCVDGFHVPDPSSGRCRYCPAIVEAEL